MTAHYNIALYPQNPRLTEALNELAATYLSGPTERYLLGQQALPHISLGQFVCQPDDTKAVWAGLEELAHEPMSIQFGHIYVLAGEGPLHAGKNWVGLSVVPVKPLIDLQQSVYRRLQAMTIDSPTKPENYFPHLTFGRVSNTCAVTISRLPEADFWQTSYPFEVSLGRSNEIGVYSERLY